MRPERYRKVSPRIWGDTRFRQLSDDAKLAFLFLLTHPHLTCLGGMRATVTGLAAEIGWPAGRFRRALRESVRLGMAELNERYALVSLPKFLAHNPPEGPNSVVKAWPNALAQLPECPERDRLVGRALAHLRGRSEAFLRQVPPDVLKDFEEAAVGDGMSDGISDGISDGSERSGHHPCDIQEQEQELEQEGPGIPTEAGTVRRGGGVGRPPDPPGPATQPAPSQGAAPRDEGRHAPLQSAWRETSTRSPYSNRGLSHLQDLLPALGTPDGACPPDGASPGGQGSPPLGAEGGGAPPPIREDAGTGTA